MSISKRKKASPINNTIIGEDIGVKSSSKLEFDSIVENENTYIIVVADENETKDHIKYNNSKDKASLNRKEVELFGEKTGNKNLMCRFCLSTDCSLSSSLMPLFSKSTKLKFISVDVISALESLTGLKVNENEDLPKYICKICLSRLEICWAFRQQCLKSDKAIRELQQATKQLCKISNSASASKINSEISVKSCRKDSKNKKGSDNISSSSQINFAEVSNLTDKKSSKVKNLENLVLKDELSKCKRKAEVHSRSPKTKVSKIKLENTVPESLESDSKTITRCEICCHEASSPLDMNEHLKTHYDKYPYLCDICKKLFKTESSLSAHVKTLHNVNVSHLDRPIKCVVCHLEVTKNNLADHFLKHKTENVQKEHSPVLRHGPLLRCSYCWKQGNTMARRMTQYHCPDCEENLCLVPCFKEYHAEKDTKKKVSNVTNVLVEVLDPMAIVTISSEEPEK